MSFQARPSNMNDTSYWDYGIIEIKTKPSEKPIKFSGWANKDRTQFVQEEPLLPVQASIVKGFVYCPPSK